jgi:hypothetical protein
VPQRVYDFWRAYYQCEPFGSEWEQTASVCSMISANTAMLAACHGSKTKSFGVVDFMPADSVSWLRGGRQESQRTGITDPKLQAAFLKQAFGFR